MNMRNFSDSEFTEKVLNLATVNAAPNGLLLMDDLQWPIYFFGFGCFVSLFVFAMEFVIYYRR